MGMGRGFTLVELLVAVGLSAGIVLIASNLISQTQTQFSKQSSEFWFEVRRNEILQAISSEGAFVSFVTFNGGPMSCLTTTDAAGCYGVDPNATRPFKIRIAGPPGKDTLDGAVANLGFNENGEICNTFNPTVGHPTCVYGVKLSWNLNCSSSALCRNPEARFIVDFSYSKAGDLKKDLSTYKISVVRGQKLNSVCQSCLALGGICNADGTCDLSSINKDCDVSTGKFLRGFDSIGKVICATIDYAPCPAGQVAGGFDSAGNLICTPGCP